MARKVKYDHDPENDYGDGYNAGRRFKKTDDQPKDRTVLKVILAVILALLLLSAFALAGYRKGQADTIANTPKTSCVNIIRENVKEKASDVQDSVNVMTGK